MLRERRRDANWPRGCLAALVWFACTTAAHADPCEGALPRAAGARFEGVVRYVGDGDSLCVGESRNPKAWIEVRLADVDAPELNTPAGAPARRRLETVAIGKRAACVVVRGRNRRTISYDRVIARCTIGGAPIGALVQQHP